MSQKERSLTLDAPVLVAQSKGYLWFPSLARLANGDLLAIMSSYADIHTEDSVGLNSFSSDGGATWGDLLPSIYGETTLRLPSGDQVFLPYYLYDRPGGMGAPYRLVRKGTRQIEIMQEGVYVTGWPRPDRKVDDEHTMRGFVFNGQTAVLEDGKHLATLYGYFDGDDRYTLVAAESREGLNWQIRSTIADANCPLEGNEGPCESALCRLADGRLMCVFRMASEDTPLGQVWSEDEGRSWSTPIAMQAHGVQPSLAVASSGAIILSTGRNGLYLYLNKDGSGKSWQRFDLQAHHNAHNPSDPITTTGPSYANTSCYTETIALEDDELICIYDRLANGWLPIPDDSLQTNSVWTVRMRISA